MSNRIKIGLVVFNQSTKRTSICLILRDHKRIIENPSDFELINRYDQDLSEHVIQLCKMYENKILSWKSLIASLDQLISQ